MASWASRRLLPSALPPGGVGASGRAAGRGPTAPLPLDVVDNDLVSSGDSVDWSTNKTGQFF